MARVKQVHNKTDSGKIVARVKSKRKDIPKMLKQRRCEEFHKVKMGMEISDDDVELDTHSPKEILQDIQRNKVTTSCKGHRVRDILKVTPPSTSLPLQLTPLNTPLPPILQPPQQFSPIQVKDIPLPPLPAKSDSNPVYENISPIPQEQIDNYLLDMPIDFFGNSQIPSNRQLTELCAEILPPLTPQEESNLMNMVDELANNIAPALSPIPLQPFLYEEKESNLIYMVNEITNNIVPTLSPIPPPPPPAAITLPILYEQVEEEGEDPPLKKKCFKRFLIYMKRDKKCDEAHEEKRTIIYSNHDQDIVCTQYDKYRELEELYSNKLYINKKYLQWRYKKIISDLREKRYVFDNNKDEKRKLECKKKPKIQ